MAVFIHPGKIKGKVVVPSSKSLSHRALLAALLSDEDTKIYNLSIRNFMEPLVKTFTIWLKKSLQREVATS